jgi:ferrochelatase
VVEASRWIWYPVLYGIILPFRAVAKSQAYTSVWTPEGSPLLVISRRQEAALRARLANLGDAVRVELAMNYGQPAISAALERLRESGVERLLVLPLYPQYSGSTTGAIFDAVTRGLRRWRRVPALRFVDGYHDHPRYIEALAASLRDHWQEHGPAARLLFSFHGTPRTYLDAGDPYFCQCHKTARLVAEALELDPSGWELAFQSRFGPKQWLQPYTSERLAALPSEGVDSVDIICPGFAADCLETLEEIAVDNREQFLSAGGREFRYVPALNDREDHIGMLETLVHTQTRDWFADTRTDPELTRERARVLGAKNI